MRGFLTDPPDEVGGHIGVVQTTVGERLGDQLHSGDRRAQLVRHVTDKVAPNSLEMVHAGLVSHHQQGRHLTVERDRSSVEVAVVQGDRTLLDTPALPRGIEQTDEPVVDLAGNEVRTLDEREAELAAGRLIGEQDATARIEADDAGIEQQSHRPKHVDAPGAGK